MAREFLIFAVWRLASYGSLQSPSQPRYDILLYEDLEFVSGIRANEKEIYANELCGQCQAV